MGDPQWHGGVDPSFEMCIRDRVLNRTGREDMAMLTSVAGLVVVLLMVVNVVAQLFNNVKSILQLY